MCHSAFKCTKARFTLPCCLPVQSLVPGNQRFAIDMDFNGLMPESDMRHLVQQLSYSYSANTSVAQPCHMQLLGFKGSIEALTTKLLAGLPNWYITRSEKTWQEFYAEHLDEVCVCCSTQQVQVRCARCDN